MSKAEKNRIPTLPKYPPLLATFAFAPPAFELVQIPLWLAAVPTVCLILWTLSATSPKLWDEIQEILVSWLRLLRAPSNWRTSARSPTSALEEPDLAEQALGSLTPPPHPSRPAAGSRKTPRRDTAQTPG